MEIIEAAKKDMYPHKKVYWLSPMRKTGGFEKNKKTLSVTCLLKNIAGTNVAMKVIRIFLCTVL